MPCLSGAYRLSRRSAKEILERVFGVPISLGTFVHLEAHTANALGNTYSKTVAEVMAADMKNVEENG